MGGSSLGERNEKVVQIGNEDVVSAGWDREQKKKRFGGLGEDILHFAGRSVGEGGG